jgi:hypothetical protein
MPLMNTNHSTQMSVRSATVETTSFYMGSLMSFLVKSSQTGNGFCLLEYRSEPGHEPPPICTSIRKRRFTFWKGSWNSTAWVK